MLYDLTYMGNQRNKQQTAKLIDTENRLVVAIGGGEGWVKWVKGVKRYKLPVTR